MIKHKITLGINDYLVEIPLTQGPETLARFLREQRHLSGVKIVCAEGDCGACSVLVDKDGLGKYQVVNSCIMPVMSMQGCHIITIEGLTKKYPEHPIKSALVESLGSQCGFCTPGFMLNLANVYEQASQQSSGPSEAEVKVCCSGHLCRCTGYQDILTGAMRALAAKSPQLRLAEAFAEIRPKIFKQEIHNYFYKSGEQTYAIPRSLKQACYWKLKFPKLRIIAGGTDLGVELNKREEFVRSWMSLKNIQVLNKIVKKANGSISVGANVSLSRLQRYLQKDHPEFAKFLNIFASPNIRHSGTLIGNIVNASPIGDTLPYLSVIGASIQLVSLRGTRELNLDDFIVGYRRTDLKDDEIVASVCLNPRPEGVMVRIDKVSKREHMDISTLSLAAVGKVEKGILVEFRCAFGGLSDRVRRIPQLEQHWLGRNLDEIKDEKIDLGAYFKPMSDHRGSELYRKIVAERLLGNFFSEIEAAP